MQRCHRMRFAPRSAWTPTNKLSRSHSTSSAVVTEVRRDRRRGRCSGVQSGRATVIPKTGDGPMKMIRVLRLTRRSAVKNRTMTAN